MSGPRGKMAQAMAALQAGRIEQGTVLALQAVRADPNDAAANSLAAQVHLQAGDAQRALHFAERAAELAPEDAGSRHNLGLVLMRLGRHAEAQRVFERAIALRPNWDVPRLARVSALVQQRRYTAAVAACDEGLAGSPGHAGFAGARANALCSCGRADEGYAALRELIAAHPDAPALHSAAAWSSNYVPGLSRDERLLIHARYGEVLSKALRAPTPVFRNTRDAERPLRVGVISPDLREHSVAFFMEPLFAGHDRAAVMLHVYQTSRFTDAMTRRLRTHAAAWRECSGLTDVELFNAIRADRIDVLIELSGHMQGHRLGIVHLRPAPVIATYLGYPNTTGVGAVGWRIVDAVTDPPGEADRFATEKLVRLPRCFVCYSPPAVDANPSPAISAREAGQSGITFGSFNALQKLNGPLLALWARVLKAAPGSRLVLKSWNLADAETWGPLLRRFAEAGVEDGRVELLNPRDGVAEHLGAYSRVDIALDTYPYHGTTTTCEAMWMGVPVVTLAGDTHASRVGASLLKAVGVPELIATSEEDYVRIAAALAGDAAGLASLRGVLREKMRASELCDAAGFCRAFEAAIRGMWREWCGAAPGLGIS